MEDFGEKKKRRGKRDRIKFGNQTGVLFGKQRNGPEDLRAESYFVKHLEMSFRNI